MLLAPKASLYRSQPFPARRILWFCQSQIHAGLWKITLKLRSGADPLCICWRAFKARVVKVHQAMAALAQRDQKVVGIPFVHLSVIRAMVNKSARTSAKLTGLAVSF